MSARIVYDGKQFRAEIENDKKITYVTSPGFLDEQMHLFLAEDLEEGEQDLDDDEDVEIVRWPV